MPVVDIGEVLHASGDVQRLLDVVELSTSACESEATCPTRCQRFRLSATKLCTSHGALRSLTRRHLIGIVGQQAGHRGKVPLSWRIRSVLDRSADTTTRHSHRAKRSRCGPKVDSVCDSSMRADGCWRLDIQVLGGGVHRAQGCSPPAGGLQRIVSFSSCLRRCRTPQARGALLGMTAPLRITAHGVGGVSWMARR